MPATRTANLKFTLQSVKYGMSPSKAPLASCEPTDHEIFYPTTNALRSSFKTTSGKRVTPHQWAVYDFTLTIPAGKVTTYKDVCLAVGGSPRSVGGALRNNPFAPFVPCHRVIASNLFIGGFVGEWGKESKTKTQCNRKLDILAKEGVQFSSAGVLKDSKETLWRNQLSP
ncbi:6-O-methylguanine DNA methyltransferase [Mycena rebaudengoi]|nr:6-O-methylguanine DNA methyltransferase [Mycena rebaudengoi]